MASLPAYSKVVTQVGGIPRFNGDIILEKSALGDPLSIQEPQLWQVCPEGDLFHEDVPANFIRDALEVMRISKWHRFMVSTRRPERMKKAFDTAPPNIWRGFSASTQDEFDERVVDFAGIGGFGHKFALLQPLLGPISLKKHGSCGLELDFISVMSEAYPGGRPMQVEWLRSLRGECEEVGIHFFWERSSWDGVNSTELDREYDSARMGGNGYTASQHARWKRDVPRLAMKAAGVWPPADGSGRRLTMPAGQRQCPVSAEAFSTPPPWMALSAWIESLDLVSDLCRKSAAIAREQGNGLLR